jgi:hypothetical protein
MLLTVDLQWLSESQAALSKSDFVRFDPELNPQSAKSATPSSQPFTLSASVHGIFACSVANE